MQRVFLCVTIDCECDKGPGWRTQLPVRFAGVSEGIARRLTPLFLSYGAKPTYLLSSEVIRDVASAGVLGALRGSHELGTHLHGECVDEGGPVAPITTEFQRDYPVEVERHKLKLLTQQFGAAFGLRPRSFRAGRFGIGANSIPLLEELGYAVDSSVTPSVDWTSSGGPGLSFESAGTQPYRPDPRAPERAGQGSLVEVPVTIHPHRWRSVPVLGRLVRGRARWLRPTFSTTNQLVRIACAEIERARTNDSTGPIFLNAMLHNVEVVPRASPYAQSERACRRILGRLAGLLRFAERHRIPCVGLGDVPGLLS
jgi:hypothetical protein